MDLGNVTIQASVRVLQRLSAADIDTYTILVGQLMAGSFQFGQEGRKRFEKAIMGLRSMQSMGNIVHFGFGIDSVIRNLATTEEGACLAVLCAAAAECYQEEYAASIMWELVRCYGAPNSFVPSAIQWKALVRACNGSLSSSSFPKIAEHFMGLDRRHGRANVDHWSGRNCSSADTLAQALLFIGKISTGKLESITIAGPSDAGWLAAIAEWMLDLRIVISTFGGTLLHANCEDVKQAQIRFIIGERIEMDQSKDLEVQAKTYHLRDFTDVVNVREGAIGKTLVCGRIPWSTALSDTFGSYFRRLIDMRQAFGKALGCAARVFEAVTDAEAGFHVTAASECFSYFSSSYGIGLVSFLCKTFPELKVVRREMDEGASKSAEDALATYEACLVNINSGCKCEICRDEDKNKIIGGNLCLVVILETILVVTRSLSGISVAEDLDPLLVGLQAFYEKQVQRHIQGIYKEKAISDNLRKVHFILEMGTPIDDGVAIGQSLQIARLADGARIFGRGQIERTTHRSGSAVSAITVGGITVFLDALLDISDDPERIGRCQVIPGRINAHDRIFTYISDLSDFNPEGQDYLRRIGEAVSEDCRSPFDIKDNYRNVSLVASESIDSLQVGLSITDSNLPRVMLGPAQYTFKYLRAFGLVECTCPAENESSFEEAAFSTTTQLESKGLASLWHFKGNTISRIIALMKSELFECEGEEGFEAIIRTRECLNCCRDTASMWCFENTLILSKNDS